MHGISHGPVIVCAMGVATPSGRALQRHPNLLQGLQHGRSGRVRGALQTRGDARVGQPVELALDQRGFVCHRQSGNDGEHLPCRVLRQQKLFRVVMPQAVRAAQGLFDGWQHLVQSDIGMAPETSEVVLTEMRSAFEHPGPPIGVFRQFPVGSLGPQERVLKEILGVRRPARQPPDIEIHLPVVLRHALLERLVHPTALHALNL